MCTPNASKSTLSTGLVRKTYTGHTCISLGLLLGDGLAIFDASPLDLRSTSEVVWAPRNGLRRTFAFRSRFDSAG